VTLYNLLALTAWRSEAPRAYGFVHLSFFFVGLTVAVYLAIKLKNIDEKRFNRVLFVCGLLLLIFEGYKQLFLTFYLNDGIFMWNNFPFHLCSMPMYLCLIYPFIKTYRKKKAIYTFMATYNFLGGFLSFIEPSGILNEYWILTYHSLFWHMMLVFIGLLIAFNINCSFDLRGFKDAVRLFMVLAVLAYLINIDVLYFTEQQTNMFFIGPLSSPLVVFDYISDNYGWFLNMLLYSTVLSFGAYIIYLLITLCFYRRSIEIHH